MVKTIEKNKNTYFVCESCGLAYKEEDKEWADKCQEWCEKNPGTCDPEASGHAVQID